MIGPEATQAAQTLLRNILDFSQKYVSVVLMKINITIKRFWKNVQINNRNMLNSDRIDALEGGLMLIRQVHQKRALFVTNGIFLDKGLKFAMGVMGY